MMVFRMCACVWVYVNYCSWSVSLAMRHSTNMLLLFSLFLQQTNIHINISKVRKHMTDTDTCWWTYMFNHGNNSISIQSVDENDSHLRCSEMNNISKYYYIQRSQLSTIFVRCKNIGSNTGFFFSTKNH